MRKSRTKQEARRSIHWNPLYGKYINGRVIRHPKRMTQEDWEAFDKLYGFDKLPDENEE